jgi:hypothetical protein
MPGASVEWLVAGLAMLEDEHMADLMAKANELLAREADE